MTINEKHVHPDRGRRTALIQKGEKYSKKLSSIVTKCDYAKSESSLCIAGDAKYQNSVIKKVEHLKGAKYVILAGIGGSNLGTEAIYSALAFQTGPRLFVLDAIEKDTYNILKDLVDDIGSVEELALVVVSKSGTTSETIANGVAALEILEEKFGASVATRTVFIGSDGTEFLKVGKKKKVTCVTFPESIGGRFSVFTAVGIVPLYLLGIDTVALREGALAALTLEQRKQTVESAVSLALLAEDGMHTVNFFTFNERLHLLGFWYRQLLAESIGKTMTTDGTTFCHQLLPTVATSVDLHSMAQLYLGGYRGMYTHFVYADTESEYHTLADHWLLRHTPNLKGHTPQEVKNAIRQGVLQAYDDKKLPYRLTALDKLTAFELGLLMSSLMCEVMVLAHLFDVNAFDQPNVESYKLHTREILKH